jgi:hypothetical protein
MEILVRALFEFKDETYRVNSLDEIMVFLEELQNFTQYNFIVFKVYSEEQYEGIRLHKKAEVYSIKYFNHTESNFDKIQIPTISEYFSYVLSFLNENENVTRELFYKLTLQNKEEEKIKYEKWKREYSQSKVLNKSKFIKNFIVGLSLISLALYVSNLFYTGDYKFIGQETEIIKAEIYKTNWAHAAGGGYHQRIYYKFKCEGKSYNDITRINKFVGERKIGDKMLLKVSKSDPMRYVILEYLTSE